MINWKEYKLSEVCENIYSGGTPSSMKASYWNGNLPWLSSGETSQRYIYYTEKSITKEGADNSSTRYAYKGSTVIASAGQGHTRGQASMLCIDTYVNQSVLVLKPNPIIINPYFLYFNLDNRYNELRQLSDGTSTRGSLSGKILKDLNIYLPSLNDQHKIVSILKSLDDKIEVNRRINDNLDQQAQALFNLWFVDYEPFKDQAFVDSEIGMIPRGRRVESLSSIADYINGLAMQNYRPEEGGKGLPVLKIKELGQGSVDDNSDLCSPSLIGEKYIINDGDIIFSWSGTLMVKVWCGGKCGLNQHLFVVVPKDYQKWFVYQWTKYHLDNFIRIAKDKAVTMGHIKRGELDKAKVVIPDADNLTRIDSLMDPIFNQIISNEIESRRLAELRDTLLPKLMSGEINVNDVCI